MARTEIESIRDMALKQAKMLEHDLQALSDPDQIRKLLWWAVARMAEHADRLEYPLA